MNALIDDLQWRGLIAQSNVAFVGTDAPEAGHMQGKMVGNYVVKNFDAMDLNKDGKLDQPGIQDILIGFQTYSNSGN